VRSGRMIRLYALGLLVISPGLLVWQRFGMNRVLRIDAESPQRILLIDDSSSGGRTKASILRQGGQLVLDAQIAAGFAWPFAEMDISLADHPPGIDLSRYDELRIKVDYQAPGDRQLRIFIRNFDPAYSDPKEPNTWKLNEVDFTPALGGEIKTIPLLNFSVTNWWITEHQVPVEHAALDMRHVPLIQISTPGNLELGHHRVAIDYLEFRGKWIDREKLALGIAGLWMASTMLLLFLDLRRARRRLRQSYRREIELKELTEALQLENKAIGEMARRDPLTGIRNRAGILDELFHEAEQAHRSGQPLAILLADVDHFKAVNDQCGHDAGDQVLCRIAQEMNRMVRKSDYLVRWGGEEFVLLCPATNLAAAQRLAEKLRQRLEKVSWPEGLRVTLSVGVTILGQEPIPQALKRADRALYDAKAQGRNCVVVLAPPIPDSERPKEDDDSEILGGL